MEGGILRRVLILSGSPRRHGNSDLLCDEFMRGAIDAGHEVLKVFLRDKLVKMLEIVINMLKLVIEGLRTEDKTKVKEAADMDKQVDEIYQELLASLITHIQVVDGKVFGTAYAILINKYIERAGDHVTNIAEEVLYALKGRRYHLN